jgi:dihydropteroate synthase
VAVTIRAAGPDDWQIWRDLRLQALTDSPGAFGERLAEVRRRDDSTWRTQVAPRPDALRLVAELDGRSAGMMVVVIDAHDRCRADVYAMWVAPEARTRGAGRKLVEAGLAWARERAALDVQLRVATGQVAARRLYEACGFAPTGERRPLRPDSELESEDMSVRLPPLVMGVVNVTPDSFSDGGEFLDRAVAVAHGLALHRQGADILDVGGEATNPKARPVTAEVELARVLPVIERLRAAGARVSIDTTKAEVARVAVAAGATIVNDVSGGMFDPAMTATLSELAGAGHEVTYIAGHLRGRTLAETFGAEATVSWREVANELTGRIATLPSSVIVWADPGIGFGKGADPEGNVALLRHAGDIAATVGRPVVVGASRKRFLRRLLGLPDAGTEVLDAASTLASLAGVQAGAHVVRVHNVTLLRTALTAYNKK